MIEAPLFSKRAQHFVKLEPVLRRYYPNFEFGATRKPIDAAMEVLHSLGIILHPDTFGAMRSGSVRKKDGMKSRIGELLLLNALLKNPEWSTPSTASIMETVVQAGLSLQNTSRFGVRMSNGLTVGIAEILNKDKPEIVSRLIRGIRIDGAYIANEIPEAWTALKDCVLHYARDYEMKDVSAQKLKPSIEKMEAAKDPKQLYEVLYESHMGGPNKRCISSFVPYELDYWKWLIDQGIIAKYKHLPFTSIVLNTHAHHSFNQNKIIKSQVLEATGIPLDGNVTSLRNQMIRHDLPRGLFT